MTNGEEFTIDDINNAIDIQEQKDIVEFIKELKKLPTGNRETHLAIVELIEKLEGKS